MASHFVWFLPTFVIECLPLILATTIYEVQIILHLFFDRPTRPLPPFQSMDSVPFLPWEAPKYAESWLGILVASICGAIWFFSEFALDLIPIALDHNIEDRNPTVIQGSSPEQHSKNLQSESFEKLASLPVESSLRSVESLGQLPQGQHAKIQDPKIPQLTHAHTDDAVDCVELVDNIVLPIAQDARHRDMAPINAPVTKQPDIPLPVVNQQPLRALDTCHNEVSTLGNIPSDIPLPNTEHAYHETLIDNACHETMAPIDDSMTQDIQTAVVILAVPNKTLSDDESFTMDTMMLAHLKVDSSVEKEAETLSISSMSSDTASENSDVSMVLEVTGFMNGNVAITHPKTLGDLSSSKWRSDLAPSRYPILSLTKAIEVAGFYTCHTAPLSASLAEQMPGANGKVKTKKRRRNTKNKNKNKGEEAYASSNGSSSSSPTSPAI